MPGPCLEQKVPGARNKIGAFNLRNKMFLKELRIVLILIPNFTPLEVGPGTSAQGAPSLLGTALPRAKSKEPKTKAPNKVLSCLY